MSRLINLFFLDFKLLTKDKMFYLKLILFPAALILILGTVFNNNSKVSIQPFDVAYFSEDVTINQGTDTLSLGNTLRDDVLKSNDVKAIVNLKEVSSYKQGEELVKDGKVSAFIYIPKDFTKAYLENTKSSIVFIGNNNKPLESDIVKNILDSFNRNLQTLSVEQKEVLMSIGNYNIPQEEIGKIMTHIVSDNISTTELQKEGTNSKLQPLGAMQYYSIGMVVMFSIMTGITIIHNVVDEKLNKTFFRIKTTPTLNIQYALGKLLGIVFAIVAQIAIVMVISSILYGMKWGNIGDILLITVVYSFTIGSIVLLGGFWAKDQTAISGIAIPVFYVFSFLGGSMMDRSSLPDFLKAIQQIIPNGKALNSYITICEGGSLKDIYINLIQLALVGVIFLTISLIVYEGRGFKKNANVRDDNSTVEATV
jgi:ABC-2 type transport system permease protein